MKEEYGVSELYDEILELFDDEWVKDTANVLLDNLIERARNDFPLFVEMCMKDNHGVPFKIASFQYDIIDGVLNNDWVYIEVPRGHGKTELITIAYSLWRIGRNPSIRIKIICNDGPTAWERVKTVQAHITNNAIYKLIFPNVIPSKGEWTKTRFKVRRDLNLKDSTCLGAGIFTTGVGGRTDLLIFDDIVDQRNTLINSADMKKVKEAFFNTWMMTQELPKSEVIMVGTPWHEDDLTQDIRVNKLFFPVLFAIGDNFEPLWEEKMPKEALIEEYELDPSSFERAFKCRPVSSRDCWFPVEWIDRCCSKDIKLDDIPDEWPKILGVDLAIGETKSNAYTVIFVLTIDEEYRRIPIDVIRGRWDFPKIIDIILDTKDKYEPETIIIEDNAFQKSVIQQLYYESDKRRLPHPSIEAFTTTKNNKEGGLRELAVEFHRREWAIPYNPHEHDRNCECKFCIWLSEMKAFPFGKFSDTVMACWFASIPVSSGVIEYRDVASFEAYIEDEREQLDSYHSIDGREWYEHPKKNVLPFDRN